MAYVGDPFAYDVFVTYSHGEQQGTGPSKLRGWSQAFARELESELRVHDLLAKDLRIFLDQHPRHAQSVDPLAPLTGQLQSDVERSAILTALMSDRYLDSKWCADERSWWEAAQTQLGIAAEGRIAVVRISPTTKPWPAAFLDDRGKELPGFCFYDEHEEEPRPYGWPEPQHNTGGPFREKLLRIVGHIRERLAEVKARLDEERLRQTQANRLAEADGQLVYLHARAEHAGAWDRAAAALVERGLGVVPGAPEDVGSDARRMQDLRQSRVEIMKECDALLLVATDNARAIDEDMVVVGKHDRNSARAKSNRPLPCGLLDSVGPPVATPIRVRTARNLNVKWIDATQPTWPPAVQEWLHSVAREEGSL